MDVSVLHGLREQTLELRGAIRIQAAEANVHAKQAHIDAVEIRDAINELVKVTRGAVEPVRRGGYSTLRDGGGHGQY